jgi:tetratricopeptide (TPR) repeat protein
MRKAMTCEVPILRNHPHVPFIPFADFFVRAFSASCVALASIVLLAGSAFADDRAECVKAAGEGTISACSRLISAGDLGSFAAAAFYNRGTAYTQSDLDAAVKDFNEALRLDPNFAAAYTARGTAYWLRGKAGPGIRRLVRGDPFRAE